jgi:hypothetical protein
MAYLRKRSRKSKKRGAGGTRKKRHYRRRQRTKRGGTIQKGQRVLFSQAGIDYYTREFHKILRPTPKSTVLTKALRQWNGVVIDTYGNRVQIKWFAPHAWDNEYGRYAARRLHWTLNGGTDNIPGEGYAEVFQQYLEFPKRPKNARKKGGPTPGTKGPWSRAAANALNKRGGKRHARLQHSRLQVGGTILPGQRVRFSQEGIDYYTKELNHFAAQNDFQAAPLTEALREWQGRVFEAAYRGDAELVPVFFSIPAEFVENGSAPADHLGWDLEMLQFDGSPAEGYARIQDQYLKVFKDPKSARKLGGPTPGTKGPWTKAAADALNKRGGKRRKTRKKRHHRRRRRCSHRRR